MMVDKAGIIVDYAEVEEGECVVNSAIV